MKKIILLASIALFNYGHSQKLPEEVIDLEFKSNQTTSVYKGVKIGEYYWMDNNFYQPVHHYAPQEQIDKHMKVWGVPYDIKAEDFNRYYGQYYGPDGDLPTGNMYEDGNLATGWNLPGVEDFNQLLAMCGTGSYTDIKEYLGAKEGDNPVAVNLKESGDIHNGHWFAPNKNVYKFSLMPGGGRMNGPWDNLDTGDFYALYKQARLRLNTGGLVNFDNLSNRVSFDGKLWHWANVRWAKRIPDQELGYKLYIKETDYKKYENSALVSGFDISTVDIKKLGIQEKVPDGYMELPKGWIRGFYIQKNGTAPVVNLPKLTSHLQILTDDNTYVFPEKSIIKVYLRTNEANIEKINLGIYNPKSGELRGPLTVISRNNFVYDCELPDNYIGNFMMVAYIVTEDGEKIPLKREAFSPWIDRLPLYIENRMTRSSYLPSDSFEVTSYMQLNIKDNGVNVVNKVFQIDMEKPFMVSMPTNAGDATRIGLFYSNGDFYTDITTSSKGSVYTCKVPNSILEGKYIIMPYVKENGTVQVIERNSESFYMDRLPLYVMEEDIWGDDDIWAFRALKTEKTDNSTLQHYIKDNNLYFKGLTTSVNIAIYNLSGINVVSKNNVSDQTGISLHSLPAGIYVVNVSTSSGSIENFKIKKD